MRANRRARTADKVSIGPRVALFALVWISSCGGGGGGSSLGQDAPPEEPDPIPLEAGATVGALETVLDGATSFVLHGTLPVPKGTFPRVDGTLPFAVLDWDGTPKAAQVEIVSRYANADDGADVVEVLARVGADPLAAPGTRAQYPIVLLGDELSEQSAAPAVAALLSGPDALPGAVATLLNNSSAIALEARDCFGNLYRARPLETPDHARLLRYGDVRAELALHELMQPVTPLSGASGTLKHLFGVHSYLRTTAGSSVILLDLRLHNGVDGWNDADPADDPVGPFYFDQLELVLPNGWVALADVEDPLWGAASSSGGSTRVPLIEPLSGAKLHLMPLQAQMQRRLALCPIAAQSEARALLDGRGLGFARRGVADAGNEYWSWWNAATPRYFPQAHRLPSLEHVGLASIRSQLSAAFDTLEAQLANGTGTGSYPVKVGNLGWAHPYGVQYGGMTGGNQIFLFEGVDTLEAASIEGYRTFELMQRMQSERQSNALVNQAGRPSHVEDWLVDGPSFDYVPFFFYSKLNSSQDPFGFTTYDSFQVDWVAAQGLQPDYESALLEFEPIDLQHLIRYAGAPMVLAFAGNDSLAKDDLEQLSETFRLGYHQYYNGSYASLQDTGMLWDRQYVDAHPAAGFRFGRGEGWGIDVAVAAWALGDDEHRARWQEWFELLAELVSDGQAACSGFLQANIAPKFLDGLYRARQMIEQSITENALRAVNERVFRGVSTSKTAMLEDVLENSLYAFLSPMAWGAGQHGPWTYSAVGPLDESLPVWCSLAQVPLDGNTGALDTYQEWSSFAYGYELSGDSLFLDKAGVMIQGELLSSLEDDGLENLQNRAALLALMQELEYGLP